MAIPKAGSEHTTLVNPEHAYDVDPQTGFMTRYPPVKRLPCEWELWEDALDKAIEQRLAIGDKLGITAAEEETSRRWRMRIRQIPVLSTAGLVGSPELLRRAHLVLAFLLHFYVQSIPPSEPISIPPSISLPILRVSKVLDVPPLLTFADTVLYNWDHRVAPRLPDAVPTPDNVRTQTSFTSTIDEEEFYLCSARIELRGVEILKMMQSTMDETFVGDDIAVRRITKYLEDIAKVINELKELLLDVKKLCNPEVYYNEVRPWFRGEDSFEFAKKRKWVFEGIETDPEVSVPQELSGPSAGQSSMVHVLDIFLGVEHQATSPGRPSFMSRMQIYMPKNHRLFLDHLKSNPRPLRQFVSDANNDELSAAFNRAVTALKEFRDGHMIIATLYIVGPARKAAKAAAAVAASAPVETTPTTDLSAALKGTGGTDLVKFLKDTRTRTQETLLP